MDALNCPNCGHHVGNITQPAPAAPVRALTITRAERLDQFTRFASARLRMTPGARLDTSEATAAYRAWCEAASEEPILSRRWFGEAARDWGIVRQSRSHGRRMYADVALRPMPGVTLGS